MKYRITESHIRKMVKECIQLLMEERYDKIKPKVYEVFKQYFLGGAFTRKTGLRFPEEMLLHGVFEHEDNPNRLTFIDYMIHEFEEEYYHDSALRDCAVARLAPMFARLALNDGNFQQANYQDWVLFRLYRILNLLYVMQKNKEIQLEKVFTDEVINTITFEQLEAKYGPILDEIDNKEEEEIRNAATNYTGESEYEIIEDVDFNTAKEIGQYTGVDGHGQICYAVQPPTWDNYNGHGKYKVYALLKKGWRDIPAVHDDETKSPYDTYGLSVIFVIVAPSKTFEGPGILAYCNTRWNHAAKYKLGKPLDRAMSRKDLSDLIQRPFDDVFKPYTKEELINKGLIKNDKQDDEEDY